MATCAPSASSWRANANPRPREPPVTRTTRPARLQYCGRRTRNKPSIPTPTASAPRRRAVFMTARSSINRAGSDRASGLEGLTSRQSGDDRERPVDAGRCERIGGRWQATLGPLENEDDERGEGEHDADGERRRERDADLVHVVGEHDQ